MNTLRKVVAVGVGVFGAAFLALKVVPLVIGTVISLFFGIITSIVGLILLPFLLLAAFCAAVFGAWRWLAREK